MSITPSPPTVKLKSRVIVYVDGFNLYFGIRDHGWRRYLWLNLQRLAENLLLPDQGLVATKYFTSRVRYPSDKQQRQSVYLDALATLPSPGFQIFYGHYLAIPRNCRHCGRADMVPSEKMTDVNIAVEMLSDAYQDSFDTALLISADSDLGAPLRKIRALFPNKRVVLAFPPSRRSSELEKLAASAFGIGRQALRNSQFADPLMTASGYVLTKPPSWK